MTARSGFAYTVLFLGCLFAWAPALAEGPRVATATVDASCVQVYQKIREAPTGNLPSTIIRTPALPVAFEDPALTSAILDDVMGKVRLFFPDPTKFQNMWGASIWEKRIHSRPDHWIQHGRFDFFNDTVLRRLSDYRPRRVYPRPGVPYTIDGPGTVPNVEDQIELLHPQVRRQLTAHYVTAVLSYFANHPHELRSMATGRVSSAKIKAVSQRVNALLGSPRERELLVDALDAQLPAYALQYTSAKRGTSRACNWISAIGLGALCAVEGLAALHGVPVTPGALANSLAHSVTAESLASITGLAQVYNHFYANPFKQWALRRVARRALQASIKTSGPASNVRQFERDWAEWQLASQRLAEEMRANGLDSSSMISGGTALATEEREDRLERANMANGLRIVSGSRLLHSFSAPELANGMSMDSVFGENAAVSGQTYQEVATGTQRRLEQLSVLRAEFDAIHQDVAASLRGSGRAADILGELEALSADKLLPGRLPDAAKALPVSVQNALNALQAVRQLELVSAKLEQHLQRIRAAAAVAVTAPRNARLKDNETIRRELLEYQKTYRVLPFDLTDVSDPVGVGSR